MRRLRGLFLHLFLWIVLPLILLLIGVAFGSLTLHQRAMRTVIAERDARLARTAAALLSERLEQRRRLLALAVAEPDAEARWGAALRSAFDQGVGRLDARGAFLPMGPLAGEGLPEAVAELVRSPGRPIFRPVGQGPQGLRIWMGIWEPWSGGILGAVSGEALGLPEVLDALRTGPRTAIYLVDETGGVIAATGPSRVGQAMADHAGVAEALQGKAGFTFYRPPGGGDEHVTSYAPVQPPGWGLLIEEPWIEGVEPALRYTLLAPLAILAVAVASLVLIAQGIRHVVRPLQALGRRAIRVAWGDFEALREPVGGIREIEELQRTLQEMAEQIRRHQSGMRHYIAALAQGQEEERRRLARELHDEMVQSLVAIAQGIRMISLDLPSAPGLERVQEHLERLSEMVHRSLQELRRVIHDLRPLYLEELGLVPALEALVQSASRGGLSIAFEVLGEERRLPAEIELAIYRIAQGALSNVIRHAQARHAQVRLEFGEEGVTLMVEDDGVGFVPPEMPGDLALRGHFGLMGMYERATRLGGHFSIHSRPGHGTRVVVFIPEAGEGAGP